MNYNELTELLRYDEQENNIFIPNEIFNDLQVLRNNGSSHISFAYSYYYLINWLYRYCKYDSAYTLIDQKKIKEILRYNPNYKKVDYITKNQGILEELGYIKTVSDFPLFWDYEEGEFLEFTYLNQMDDTFIEYYDKPRNFKLKYPIKSFTRFPLDKEYATDYKEGYEDGTYHEIDNTHLIEFDVFLFCMSNESIGCSGFYLYSFLKHMNDMFNGYDVSLEELSEQTGIKSRSLDKYLDVLKKFNMIQCEHNQEFFCLALDKYKRKANTYYTNDYTYFSDKPITYEKIKVMTRWEYYKKLEKEQEERDKKKAVIEAEALPY